MRSLALAAVLFGGCDRVFGMMAIPDARPADASDAAVDATPGHDEDSDGIADDLDDCPIDANHDQADGDGDHVGDACDPHLGGDRIALFDPFIAGGHTPWTTTGTVSFGADEIALGPSLGAIHYEPTFTTAVASIRFTEQTYVTDMSTVGVFVGEWSGLAPQDGVECDSVWSGGTLYARATAWVGGNNAGSISTIVTAAANGTNHALTVHFDTGACAVSVDAANASATVGMPASVPVSVVMFWQNTSAKVQSAIVYD